MCYFQRRFISVWHAVLLTFCFLPCSHAEAIEVVERAELYKIFRQYGIDGTFVVANPAGTQAIVVNLERAQQRKRPASTFKIANSIIALETEAVADVDEVIPYGGLPQRFPQWEHDMSLRQAIRVSNVPVYQEVARRIGLKRFHHWLNKFEYGNQSIGSNVETFWLRGPLKISAVEQVSFLTAFLKDELDISGQTTDSIIQITALERKGARVLHGKTGWSAHTFPQTGWFVGWVKSNAGFYPFALNIDMRGRGDRHKRKRIAKEILSELGIY